MTNKIHMGVMLLGAVIIAVGALGEIIQKIPLSEGMYIASIAIGLLLIYFTLEGAYAIVEGIQEGKPPSVS